MLHVDRERCTGCGSCEEVCPESAIYLVDGEVNIHSALCSACGACVEICPAGALSMDHESLPVLQRNDQKMGEVEIIQPGSGFGNRLAPWVGFALAILDRWLVPRAVEALVDTVQRRSAPSKVDGVMPATTLRDGFGNQSDRQIRRRRRRRGMAGRDW
jgi:Fe-S-cluster-containing hydrogenase component 2